MKFGFSISAHYRLLNNTENVSKLVAVNGDRDNKILKSGM